MCGLVGFTTTDDRPTITPVLRRMMHAIAHRGPDDCGVWHDDGVALGHQRLSILDLSERGHQPFVTADGNGVLVYNGEVYNFQALRRTLERAGVHFISRSDSEVVLYALHLWGPEEALPQFNGMFSLAYYNVQTRTLVLARDRLGIKPLYATRTKGRVIFASEIKALLAHPDVPCVPDRHALTLHALLHRLEGDMTPFEGIVAVQPGTFWQVRGTGVTQSTYFDVLDHLQVDRVIRASRVSPEELISECEQALVESVQIHLASDAPLATMCSGGVDSALITAIVAETRPDVVAYVADVENTVSEGSRARIVARHLGIDLRQVDVTTESLLRLWPQATWYGDQPNTHINDMPMLAVARACQRDGFKVALTGEGSDELFGGYDWQAETLRSWRRWRRHPLRRLLNGHQSLYRFARLLPKPLRIPNSPFADVLDLPLLGGASPLDRYTARTDPNVGLRLLFPLDPNRQIRSADLFHKLEGAGSLEERAFLARGLDDLYGHLESLLKRNDRMGMGASLETRVPFLENRLIDFGMHAPCRAKLHEGHGKWIIKEIARRRRLPHEIVYAPKLGFPVSKDYLGYGLPLLEHGMVAGLFRWGSRTRQLVPDLLRQNPLVMWNILSIEIWARLYLAGESADAIGETLVTNLRVSRAHV